jgi:hypothetical protein
MWTADAHATAQIDIALGIIMAGSTDHAPSHRQVYLAAALCIALGLFSTVLAVWQLHDSDTSDRLVASPWSCCLADLPSTVAQD